MPDQTIRETLESVIASDAQADQPPSSPPPAPAAETAPQPPADTPADTPAEKSTPPAGKPDVPRHPDGRFAPRAGQPEGADKQPPQKTPEQIASEAKKAADDAANATQRQALRPPQSLKPVEREAWTKADPVLQEAIVRREREVQHALQQTAAARHFTQRMTEVLSPYIPLIQANGGDPFAYIGGLLHASNALTHGGPQFKAQIIAELVKQFNVDIEMLDTALAGLPLPAAKDGATQQLLPQVQQIVQQQLAPVQQFLSQIQQQREQAYRRAYEAETQTLEQFAADPRNEFFEDVRDIMADLIEVAADRGIELSYEDAYRQACNLHPDVRKAIMLRDSNTRAQSAAQQMTQAAQRAKSAAVSVSGSPATGAPANAPGADEPLSIRASIERAIAAQAG